MKVKKTVVWLGIITAAISVTLAILWFTSKDQVIKPVTYEDVARVRMFMIETALERFHRNVGRYPTTGEGLSALIHSPEATIDKWKGPYLPEPDIMKDPWGADYHYRCPAKRDEHPFDLWSLGRDGRESGDDIRNH